MVDGDRRGRLERRDRLDHRSINFLYLMTQIVMAVDDVGRAQRRFASVMRFLRSSVREIAGLFGVVLLLVLLATAASILATAGLGLIGFVPIVAVAVMPLQIAAWLLRGIVFQYLALTALGGYLNSVPSLSEQRLAEPQFPTSRPSMIDYDSFFSRAAGHMKASAISKMGGVVAQGRDIVSFAPGFPAPETFRVAGLSGNRPGAPLGPGRIGAAVRPDARLSAAASMPSPAIMATPRRATTADRLLVTTGSQQGLDLVARVLLDPHDVILVELPTYTGAISAFRNVQAEMIGVRQGADGIDLGELDDTCDAAASARGAARGCCTSCRTSRTRRACSSAWRSARRCSTGRSAATCSWSKTIPIATCTSRTRRPRPTFGRCAPTIASGRVVYLSSFSKTLAPGYRVAWIDAPPPVAAKMELAKQAADLCTGELDQRVVYEACAARHPRSAGADAAALTTSTSAT